MCLYLSSLSGHRPLLVEASRRLQEPVDRADVQQDMEAVNNKLSQLDLDHLLCEQVLPSFYSEDAANSMNLERRRDSLAKLVAVIRADIEREKKGKAGVENLAKALRDTPRFGGEDSQQDVTDKLQHMAAMITYLEACRYKIYNSLMDLEGRPRKLHPLSAYIEVGREQRSGMARCVLRMPRNRSRSQELEQPHWDDLEDEYPVENDHANNYDHYPRLSHYAVSPVMSKSNSNSSTSLHLDAVEARGTADGGFHVLPEQVISSDIRDAGDGSSGGENFQKCHKNINSSNLDNNDLDDSEFDDFSDSGGEAVNIIETVHGGQQQQQQQQQDVVKDSTENEVDEIYIQTGTGGGANPTTTSATGNLGACRAIYDYDANIYDELTIRVGDRILVREKQADGWWMGQLERDGTVGIFPATYVQEENLEGGGEQ